MRSMTRFLIPLVAATSLAACGWFLPDPLYVQESPVGSGTWVEIDGYPDWVTAPPAREGYLRYVAEGKSNARSICASGDRPSAKKAAAADVRTRLEPVVGAERAAAAAARAVEGLVLVHRVSKDELLTRRMVPGNTLSTAYALWEIAIADVVAPLPDDVRSAAAAALASR